MRHITTILAAGFVAILSASVPAAAQSNAQQIRAMLDATTKNWIAFRNYEGTQYIYFTQLVSMKCGLKEVRFSLNGPALDHNFELPECNWQIPFNIDEKFLPFISMPVGGTKSISIEVTYADGEKSPIHTYAPCDVSGDATCAQLLQ